MTLDRTTDLPGRGVRTRIFDVEYVHLALPDGDDLYLTAEGLPWGRMLLPENYWSDRTWFREHSQPLPGTSTVFRIRTKPVDGRGRDIVLKWNRMGQDVPGGTLAHELDGAEFNSPFEEFALTTELRRTRWESPGAIRTHKPLAIYVPRGRLDLDRLGRKEYKLQAKQEAHKDVVLDMHRRYAVIYEWVKGLDAAEAYRADLLDREELDALIRRAEDEMRWKGFVVHDNKPQHLIVRRAGPDRALVRDRHGQILYATVDFELLQRTPRREQAVRAAKRRTYLTRQAHRFEADADCPPHLAPVRLLGVDYIHGMVESTGGALWVVGKDAALFDYFLPERWRRTPRQRLSSVTQTYETTTKDNIHLVWRVSRVGQRGEDGDPAATDAERELARRRAAHGFNSPFEEVAFCQELSHAGLPTVYPRAVYMTGSRPNDTAQPADPSRYQKHAPLLTPTGRPVLQPGHDYILVWGFWNGPDEELAQRDEDRCRGVSVAQALEQDLITQGLQDQLMHVTTQRLADLAVEDLALQPRHLLVSVDPQGELMRDPDGLPGVRLCNFECMRHLDEVQE